MSERMPIPDRPEPNNEADGGDLPVWFYVVIGALAILLLFLIVMGALEWKSATLLHFSVWPASSVRRLRSTCCYSASGNCGEFTCAWCNGNDNSR